METLLLNISCQIDKMKVLGKGIDSSSCNFLSLLKKYQTYIVTNNLNEYSNKINKLIYTLENTCCKIIQ